MDSTLVRRARVARLSGLVLMLLGLAVILWVAAASVHPGMTAGYWVTSGEPWGPLRRLPLPYPSLVALLVSLPCIGVMWLGAAIATRQTEVFEAHKRDVEDRMRRVAEYGGDGRIEPHFGSPITLDDDRRF